MKRIITLAICAFVATAAMAQKPALDHSVYDGWKSLVRPVDQMDKEWVIFGVSPQEGDGVIHFYNSKTGVEYSVDRGSTGRISVDGTRAVFRISPKFQETRQAKIAKKKADEMPKDTLAVIDLTNGSVKKYPMLKTFKVADDLVDYIVFSENKPAPKPEKKEEKKKGGKNDDEIDQHGRAHGGAAAASAGNGKNEFYVLNIKTFAIDTLKCVDNCWMAPGGKGMAFTTKPGKKDSTVSRGLFLYDFASKVTTTVLTGDNKAKFGTATFNREGDKVAFYANLDTAKDAAKVTDIYLYENGSTRKVASHNAAGLPDGWKISDKASIGFRGNDSFITIGTCPVPREKDTTLVDFEQPKLDIWVWNEDYIQPIQKNNLARTKAKTYTALVNLGGNGEIIQLADEEIPNVTVSETNSQAEVLAFTEKPYRVQQQWESATTYDIYKINLSNGGKELVKKGVKYSSFTTSPDGQYTLYFDKETLNWYIYTLATGQTRDLTSNLGVIFYDDEDDHPSIPPVCGPATWFDDNRTFILCDKYDIWQFDATGATAPKKLTDGRDNRIVYRYYTPYFSNRLTASKGTSLLKERPMYFTTFNRTSKMNGFAMLDITKKKAALIRLVEGPYTYNALSINTSGKKPIFTYTKGNYEVGNNVWCTRDMFKTEQQISDINPQQKDYNWGTVELVSWTTEDGIKAEGLLYKPEDFDATKKYPVIIYFYEKYSDELYGIRTPAPSASTVNIPYFVSNGYICFIPDIYYTDGHPGKSALKSILPACDMLCENPWIDGDNMAIQGQSWGGYQTAYMITQTNRFKAAGAGAPVSNMTSAYGGIRWESGRARTGQYEHGQSRIGKNLWDGFDLYYENSPLFFVPNVETPVLIMHNDADGAVPWWQGIEFFNALRRCGKQAWLLQYNDEAHNLKERRNRKDLSIRLAQFFDHFLKGAPAPIWMTKGVPAELKGIDYGYGYEVND